MKQLMIFIASLICLASIAEAQTYTVTYSKKLVLAENAGASTTDKLTVQSPTLSASWTLTLPDNDGNANYFLQTDGNGNTSWASALTSGVTSLVIVPSILTATGTTGDITIGLANQSANTVFAGPTSGSAAPTFRSLVAADLPNPGGDVSGSYGSMTVAKINGNTVPANAAGVLTNDGSGNLTWSAAGSGTVTNVTASAPLSSSGGTTPNITISQATTSTNGYLSSTDWNTFNNKQNALTFGNLTSSDITVTGGAGAVIGSGTTLTIGTNAVTNAKFRQSAGLSVVGRSANTTGDVADITAGTDGHVLRRSGTTLDFGQIATAGIADDAVTYAKIQNVTDNRLLGRSAGSNGDAQEITIGSGLTLSGGQLSATGGSSSTIIKVKTASQAVINAGVTNDNTLSASLTAGTWLVRGMLIMDVSAGGNAVDAAVDFTYSGTSSDFTVGFVNNGGKGGGNNSNDGPSGGRWTALSTSKTFDIDASKEIGIAYEGYIVATGSGTLQVRFGNGTVGAGNTTNMLKGSTLVVEKQ